MQKLYFFLIIFSSTCFFITFSGSSFFSIYPPMIFTFILLLCNLKIFWNTASIITLLSFTAMILISMLHILFEYGMELQLAKPYLLIIYNFLIFIVLYNIYLNGKISTLTLRKIVTTIIIIQLIIFYLQLVLWHAFQINLDISKLTFGPGNRTYSAYQAFRPTGLYDEPGIYGAFIYALFCIRYTLKRKLNMLDLLIFISMILTFSMYSYLLLFSFLVWYFFFIVKGNNRLILFIALMVLAIILFILTKERIDNILSNHDPSNVNRVGILEYFINSPSTILYGVGLLPVEYYPVSTFQAMGDLTFPISSIIIFGIIFGTIITIAIISFITGAKTNKYALLALTPLIKFSMITWFFFWIYILCVKISLSQNKKE